MQARSRMTMSNNHKVDQEAPSAMPLRMLVMELVIHLIS